MGRMKEIYVQVYDELEGNIPLDYTIADYLEQVNLNRQAQIENALRRDEIENQEKKAKESVKRKHSKKVS